jgi:hypothetical protein
MDPITLVVAAFVAGLSSGVTETAKVAVMDTYKAFKERLTIKTVVSEDAKDALEKVEREPQSKARQDFLKEELAKLDVDEDQQLVKMAQTLLEQIEETGTKFGKYSVSISDSQGIVIGDDTEVTQYFGNKPEDRGRS